MDRTAKLALTGMLLSFLYFAFFVITIDDHDGQNVATIVVHAIRGG